MNRRELIKQIAILTGTAVVGSEFFLSGCKSADRTVTGVFTDSDIAFFDDVAETILPKTKTPGAKEARVGQFMALYATDCYEDNDLKTFQGTREKLNEASQKIAGKTFMNASQEDRTKILIQLDKEAKDYQKANEGKTAPAHYFTLVKQLTMMGFFSSKPGVTQVLRYKPVPGKYEGCIDYEPGQTSWA